MPMKLVTVFADWEGEKCMCLDMYNTKLLAFAKYAKFSSVSTTTPKIYTYKKINKLKIVSQTLKQNELRKIIGSIIKVCKMKK